MIRTRLFSLALICALIFAASCAKKSSDDASAASGASGASASPGASSGASAGLATVSQYDSGPRAGETPINDAMAEKGEGLFKTKGCTACHTFGKKLTGPDLAGVSMRRTALWMENQILHPDVMVKTDPISHGLYAQFALQMPNQGLTPEEARAVIEYFKHTDHEAGEKAGESH